MAGPSAALLGLLLYAASSALGVSAKRQWLMLVACCIALIIPTLIFIQPGPALKGYVMELEIKGCEPPAQSTEISVKDWEKRVAQVTWASPREGWREEMRRALKQDEGAVVKAILSRRNEIRVTRKPWNRGQLISSGWEEVNYPRAFYISRKDGSCAEFRLGAKAKYFTEYDLSALSQNANDWPTRNVSDFLGLQTLKPLPEPYLALAGN